MSSRDRKRAARRKRKDRSANDPESEAAQPEITDTEEEAVEAASTGGPTTADPFAAPSSQNGNGTHETIEDVAAEAERRGISRSEIRNERAREDLEPLEAGERPTVVTIGALVSLAIALSILIAYAAGVKVDVDNSTVDERPNAFQVFPPAILFLVMAWGMWGARYWAVLGFQAIMAIIMIGAFLTLIAATTVFKAISAGVILIAVGALFWFTVKALARIQMPTPEDRSRR